MAPAASLPVPFVFVLKPHLIFYIKSAIFMSGLKRRAPAIMHKTHKESRCIRNMQAAQRETAKAVS